MQTQEREWTPNMEGAVEMTPTIHPHASYPMRQVQWDPALDEQEDEYPRTRAIGHDRQRERHRASRPFSPEYDDSDDFIAAYKAELQEIRTENRKLHQSHEHMLNNMAELRDVCRDVKSLAERVRTLSNAKEEHQQAEWSELPPPPPPAPRATDREEDNDGDWPPPPPWPPTKPECYDKGQMVSAIDRMMCELQLLKQSTASSSAPKASLSSTPRAGYFSCPMQPGRPTAARPFPAAGVATHSPIFSPSNFRAQCAPGLRSSYSPSPRTGYRSPHLDNQQSFTSSLSEERVYRGPKPNIPLFKNRDPMEYAWLKIALKNLLPEDSTELFKYQVLIDHLKLEEACLIADSYLNSPTPYSDTMSALDENVTYAMLDDGSEHTMLLPEAASQLGLEGTPEELSLRTIRRDVQVLRGACVSFHLSPAGQQKRSFKITHAFTSPHLYLAERSYPIRSLQKKYKHLVGLPLEQFARVKPLILIGADHPHLLTPIEPVRLGLPGGPAAIHTRLGWTLQGPARLVQQTLSEQQCLFTTVSPQTTELMANVQKLWQMDVLPFRSDKVVTRSKEDQEAVEMLEAKTARVEIKGVLRYATPLLRKRQMPLFQATKEAVMPSLRSTWKRLARDPQLAEAYCEKICKLVRAGPVKKLGPDLPAEGESWFIPHHLVQHNEKNRIVFNCSYQFRGLNLNESLLPGPTLGASLLGVSLRFRQSTVAISGDIRSMFHQVRLLPQDRPLLKFVWRDMRRDDPPDVYEWQVLPFGTTCSPCCAMFALQRRNTGTQLTCQGTQLT